MRRRQARGVLARRVAPGGPRLHTQPILDRSVPLLSPGRRLFRIEQRDVLAVHAEAWIPYAWWLTVYPGGVDPLRMTG